MEKRKIDNNLVLVDDIMGTIMQTDEWEEIQLNDPRVVAATNALQEKMAALRPLFSFKEYFGLEKAVWEAATSIVEPAIMYGIHVALALQDVTGRIPDYSRYILQKIGGEQDED